MKKVITLICAFVIGFVSFAQKNEIKAIEKALKSDNFASAKSALSGAEALLGNMDDKTKAKYYFLKAKALYSNGTASDSDFDASIKTLDDLKALESKMGKLKYTEEANTMKSNMLQSVLTKADEALQNKDYIMASKRFEKAHKLSPIDTSYLYYAASTAVSAKDYKMSLGYYIKLKELGYTGLKMNYYANNIDSGKEELFSTKNARDLSVKAKLHEKPRDEMSKSKSAEIIKNIALIYVAENENEKAIAAMSDARNENPDDLGLILSEANVHLKMGNKDKFKDLMIIATEKDPNNAELQYNLGVLAAESGDNEAAKSYYEKAISLNPDYTDAYTNMAVVILGSEAEIVEEMNGLGNSSADNKRYDELRDSRINIYKKAIPFLEKALDLSPKNIDAATTLKNIYSTVGETEKFKAMKLRIEELEAGN